MSSLFEDVTQLLREKVPFFRKSRYCPICDREYGEFKSFGVSQPRSNALCPGCRSLERHRLLWMVMERASLLPSAPGRRLLHVAPEACLSGKLADIFEYISIDAEDSLAQMRMDITQLDFPDGYFDAIICNHVLEHVVDDRKALSELYRVLREGGWASIQVPMEGDVTLEDPSVTEPLERARLYGQSDHVRKYGGDFLLKLQQAGFSVQIVSKSDLLDRDTANRISVDCEESVWISRK